VLEGKQFATNTMTFSSPCPHCGHKKTWVLRRDHRKCSACRREWSVSRQYPVSGFRYTRQQWLRFLEEFLRDEKGIALIRECRVSKPTAYKITKRIQTAMVQDVPPTFSGTVEADATFLGGAWKNKRIHIRLRGTKRGRGTSKQCIFGLAQRFPGRIRTWFVISESRAETWPPIKHIISPGSLICSDECGAYQGLANEGYRHQWVNHSRNEFVRGGVHTQTLDGFWGQLKNFLASKGGVRRSELPRFVAEFVWRYNHRELLRKEQARRLLNLLLG